MSQNIRAAIFDKMLDQKTLLFYDLLVNKEQQIEYSPHLGYPNFIPLGLGMLDPVKDLAILNAHAQALLDPSTIWSQYGIISLSK